MSQSVLEYEVERGRLHVEHAYPHDAVPTPSAHVDIDLVLESLNDATLRNGAWLNVIGYVKNGEGTRMKRRKSTKDNKTDSPEILVQAILIWDAGSVNVDIYEKTIEMNRQALRDARKVHQRCIGDKSLPK